MPLAAREASDTVGREPEVLVVGAGPVGLFTALLLARRGVRVEIVDQERRPAARSYALALHPASLRLLDAAGLADVTGVIEKGHRIDRVAFYEGKERRAEMDLAALPSPYPCAAVIPQQTLEGLLESRFEQEGGRVLWRHRTAELHLGGGAAVAVLERLSREGDAVEETRTVRPAVVVGADGHHSVVRRALKASYVEMSPPELFAIFEIAADAPPLSEVRVLLDEQGAGVLWSWEATGSAGASRSGRPTGKDSSSPVSSAASSTPWAKTRFPIWSASGSKSSSPPALPGSRPTSAR